MPIEASHRFSNEKRRRPDEHHRQAMLTPGYVVAAVRELFGGSIGLDPCTEPDNPLGAERFYCLPADGCSLPWEASSVFCNPPYGQARDRWVRRCIEEGARRRVLLLIPAHTETRIFQEALRAATGVFLVQARLRFSVLRENGRQEAASHGSALFGWNVNLSATNLSGVALAREGRS